MFHNKQILVANLQIACEMLQNRIVNVKMPFCIYGNRVAIKHYKHRDTDVIRLWKTKSLFDIWYDDFISGIFVAGIDYCVNTDHVKIEYMNIHDDFCTLKNDNKLNKQESNLVNHSLLEYMKQIAKENNKNKIIVDVHHNLKIFDQYYKNEGFVSTLRTAADNPNWVEAEFNLGSAQSASLSNSENGIQE